MAVHKNFDGIGALAGGLASGRVSWSDLKVFLYVAEVESFSAAAKQLQTSQPTVTQRIAVLEDRLQARLFIRSPNGVTLTEAGRAILEDARIMQRAAQSIERRVRDTDKREQGRVRLAAPDGIAGFWLAPRLAAFNQAYPGIQLSIDAGFWPDSPARDELDVSLQYHDEAPDTFVVRPIATVHFMGYASRAYIQRVGEPLSPREALDDSQRFMMHRAARHQPETWDSKAEALGRLLDPWLDTNCSASLLIACQTGAGIAALPTCVSVSAPDLIPIGETPVASPKLCLVYHSGNRQIARVGRTIDWLKAAFDSSQHPYFRADFVHPRYFTGVGGGFSIAAT
jgi:DNA-binding transcriptional LysR family regulator